MKFTETPIKGAFTIELEKRGDDRGFFARLFCTREFQQHGLNPNIAQINDSISRYRGTLRGIHYQIAPKAEDKTFRCLRGSLFDVVIDLRPESPTFLKYFTVELTAENRTMVCVPKGCANSFLTLEDNTEIFYLASRVLFAGTRARHPLQRSEARHQMAHGTGGDFRQGPEPSGFQSGHPPQMTAP